MPVPIAHFILHSKCIRWGLCHTVVLSVNEIKKQNSYHKFLLVWFNHFEKISVFCCFPQTEFISSWMLSFRNWSRYTFLIQPHNITTKSLKISFSNTINSVYCKKYFILFFHASNSNLNLKSTHQTSAKFQNPLHLLQI